MPRAKLQLKTVLQGEIPAPQTLEFMNKITTEVELMKQNIEHICKKLDENSTENTEAHKEIMAKMDNFIEGCEKKYAVKAIEKVVYGVIIIFALAALYFIFNQVGLPH